MITEEFEINPDSEEMRALEEFLSSIEVETLSFNKFKIKYDKQKLLGNRTLRRNLWLWLLWYWRLNEAKIEFEQSQIAKKNAPDYAR